MSARACTGVAPLTARLELWQQDLLEAPALLERLLEEHGSPLNLIAPAPMASNLAELDQVARRHDLDFRAFFARKANKSLALVDEALALGAGIDVAGEAELAQALARGASGGDLVVTAAIKPAPLIELCADEGATCVIDNADELALAGEVAAGRDDSMPIAFRLAASAAAPGRPPTRFGLPAPAIRELVAALPPDSGLRVEGIHFHIDGYQAEDRARALRAALGLADALGELGHAPGWVDIGGGIPMRYIADPREMERFWAQHTAALLGERPPLTYLGHGLGLRLDGGEIAGEPAVYPAAQQLVRGAWLEAVLRVEASALGAPTLARALSQRDLQLRCEPGRSLLDGCGMTLARVAFRKRAAAGENLIGLEMNRTQTRTTADDSMLDPILVGAPGAGEPSDPLEGYLVGAYCIERELITWRRLRFPAGVAVGDIIAFPNTAGYFMHILESSSHQMPLARNVVVRGGEPVKLDPIDASAGVPAHG